MPNDAKLGLLAGVLGVIVVAVVSAGRPPIPRPPGNSPTPQENAPSKVATPAVDPVAVVAPDPRPAPTAAPAVLSAEPPSTPVVRTRREPDATPASRTRDDDLD